MEERTWFKEMAMYQIWPRSFCDGNNDGIGDLKGVLSKLEYIKSLGVDAIWFSPLYVSPQADYGYDIADYCNINPEYGTLDDFKEVLTRAHELGLKVVMDLVINHTSDQHEWFKKSVKRIEPYTDFYIWRKGKGKDGKKAPNNWMSTFPGSAWEYNEERGEYYLHLYAKEQPDLNHDNPKVREAIKGVMRFWLDMGVDGFREDVITQISKAEGLPNGNPIMPASRGLEHYNCGPHIHEYLSEYREVLKDYDAFQVGEAPFMTPEKALTFVNENKKELDMMISFQHMEADCIMIEWMKLPFNLVKLKKIYNNWQTQLFGRAWNVNYLENHDHARIISRYGSEKYRIQSGKCLAMMYTFLSGTQFIYQGQEIGMTSLHFDRTPKGTDPWTQFKDVSTFCVRDLMKKFGFTSKHILKVAHTAARDCARTPVQWSDAKNAGFCTGTPWYTVNPNYKKVNVEAAEKDPNSILNFYRLLIALRKEYKDAAIYGKFEMHLKRDKNLFVYDKIAEDGSKLTVILNVSTKRPSCRKVRKFIPEGATEIVSVYSGPFAKNMRPYAGKVFYTPAPDAKISE
ncbi:MAG: alpha-glucosidase [Clostridia bacterium]|nr:alpha-glucosidase [Clostridia bacterium]